MNYVSSITTKYGDVENVKSDVKVLTEIFNRQGSALLIDVIAELSGTSANMFKLNPIERKRVITTLINDLTSALEERL